jgi:hypothetical protein
MLRFYAEHYVRVTRLMATFGSLYGQDKQKDEQLSQSTYNFLESNLKYAERHFKAIGLGVCEKHLQDIADALKKGSMTGRRLEEEFFQLYRNLDREISAQAIYFVPKERSSYCEPSSPLFGLPVYEKFKKATTDIEEAGKCLAFGRGTACVFHLMRIMEVGLRSLAKGLGIPYAPSWESYLRQIETKISEKHSKKTKKWKTWEPFYRDSAGDLQLVKIAWRNPTMHIERSYTPEEAEDVFRAVRSFMQRLSIKFDGDGPIKEEKGKLLTP